MDASQCNLMEFVWAALGTVVIVNLVDKKYSFDIHDRQKSSITCINTFFYLLFICIAFWLQYNDLFEEK